MFRSLFAFCLEDEYRGQTEGTKRRDGGKKEKWERKGLHNLARDRSLVERLRVRKLTYTRFANVYSILQAVAITSNRVKYPRWLACAFHFDFHAFVQLDQQNITRNIKRNLLLLVIGLYKYDFSNF